MCVESRGLSRIAQRICKNCENSRNRDEIASIARLKISSVLVEVRARRSIDFSSAASDTLFQRVESALLETGKNIVLRLASVKLLLLRCTTK